jgi:hypothetical protein
MSQTPNSKIAVIGIDIGKNSAADWRAGLPLGHATTFAAAPGLRVDPGRRWGVVESSGGPCLIGMEACVAERAGSKSKNPDAPAVKRLDDEEWGRWSAAKPRRSSR